MKFRNLFRYTKGKKTLVASPYDDGRVKGIMFTLNGDGILLKISDADDLADTLDIMLEKLDPSVT